MKSWNWGTAVLITLFTFQFSLFTCSAAPPPPSVTFRPGGGVFAGPIKIELRTTTPGAEIRYSTDGTLPTPIAGQRYSAPLLVDKTTTLRALAVVDGKPVGGDGDAIYLFNPPPPRTTLHLGNSLTGNAVARFSLYVRTAGLLLDTKSLLMGGGIARTLWNTAMIGPADPRDESRWKDLFTTSKSMGGVATYKPEQIEKAADDWKKLWSSLVSVTDVTFQPRDADLAEEADYTIRWLKFIRQKFPDIQPWLYIEWTEQPRQRATDKGLAASSQMSNVFPALTWEESMSAMMLYGEEVQKRIGAAYGEGKPLRIMPVALAMGWIHRQIEAGRFPGAGKEDFFPLLFSDKVHLTPEGSFLVDAVWFACLYGQSPEGRLLPLRTKLTREQADAMTALAWDVVSNYPGSGLYESGSVPLDKPEFSPRPSKIADVTRVTLSASTPGAWFRYTLDGTEPTPTRGYIYCGAISVRPGMTVKAIAYKHGMADSSVVAATY